MILTCPECATKYVVKDGAIPPGGRQVRCASCKHSWHQDPEAANEAGEGEQSIAEAAMIEPRSGPEAEERAFAEAALSDREPAPLADDADVTAAASETVGDSEPAAPPERDEWPATGSDGGIEGETPAAPASEPASEWLGGAAPPSAVEFEPFYEPEAVEAQRRRVPVIAWLLLLAAVLAAAAWFLAPESLRERLGLAGAVGTELKVMVTNHDRQRLASGNQLFAVSGRVINPTDEEQKVPRLKAELLDASKQKVVYSWIIDPPAPTLAPGTSASFNSAEVDVPEGGVYLHLTLEGGTA